MDAARYAEFYRRRLLDDVMPFWLTHSPDRECGGYFTCLDRRGQVFDTDKFMWLQGREVWTLAKMHRHVRGEPGWLESARAGAAFIRDHGFDPSGRAYFALRRDGRPYARTCIFSDCFCAMGLAEYAAADGADWAGDLAMRSYRGVQEWLKTRPDPSGRFLMGARPMESMVYDMINVNLSAELASTIEDPAFRRAAVASMERVRRLFIDRAEGLVFEHVAPDGTHPDTFRGRLICPGHALECLWFLVDAGRAWARDDLADAALDAVADMVDFGWDAREGGFFYFMDARGKPPEQLECSQKLWWVHAEALVCLLTAYRQTGREDFARWFERVHDYAWARFADAEHGEWYGYLDRHGRPVTELKGGKWKGCFHLPRSLWMCWRILEELKGRAHDGQA